MTKNKDELNIKDIIDRTKNNIGQPYGLYIPKQNGIYEVEVAGFERKPSAKGYDMLVITVIDENDREARVTQMLELQCIEGTLRLIKGLYVHNTPEAEKDEAREKINKYFDGAKDEADLQQKCVDILQKMIDKGCVGWLKVEFKNETDEWPDKRLTAYEPKFQWITDKDKIVNMIENSEPVADEDIDDIFNKRD